MATKAKAATNGVGKRRLAGIDIPLPGEPAKKSVTIPKLQILRTQFVIRGITPLIVCKFDEKVKREMEEKTEGKAKNKKEPKDPEREWNAARHISEAGWDGIHAGGVRAAIIDAARMVEGLTMTELKQSIFIKADGYSKEGAPLVRIIGKPEKFSNMCRTTTGVAYPRHRPRYSNWSATLSIESVGLSAEEVANLVKIAGFCCGLCEWRPTSPKSKTGDNGRFVIEGDETTD
jgi:hypothetical protein